MAYRSDVFSQILEEKALQGNECAQEKADESPDCGQRKHALD
jgi:hypothetical protein